MVPSGRQNLSKNPPDNTDCAQRAQGFTLAGIKVNQVQQGTGSRAMPYSWVGIYLLFSL